MRRKYLKRNSAKRKLAIFKINTANENKELNLFDFSMESI